MDENMVEGKDPIASASQPDPRTVPDDAFLASVGIDSPSPSENVGTPAKPQPATPAPEAPPPVAAETSQQTAQRKWLDKFENPDDLEKYAQEVDRAKTSLETENKMLRKEWDKYLDSLSQPVPYPTGNNQQPTPTQVNQAQRATTGFKVTSQEVQKIINENAEEGLNEVFNRWEQYLETEKVPRYRQAIRDERYQEIAAQEHAKQVHDTFYGTYGSKIKEVLPKDVDINAAKPLVKLSWDRVYSGLNDNAKRQVDANPILLFPRVADETIKLIRFYGGNNGGNGSTPASGNATSPAPVLSGGGSRPAPVKNPLEPTVITTPEGYKAQLNDPSLIDWFKKNKT